MPITILCEVETQRVFGSWPDSTRGKCSGIQMLTLGTAHHNVGGLPARMMNGVSNSLELLLYVAIS